MTSQIVQYDSARRELELCVTLEDTKVALDKTSALAFYAKQNNDTDMEKWVAEIKLRARRKIGEISSHLEKAKANQNNSQIPSGGKKQDQLKAAGISTSVANRCEKIAQVPEEKFEEILALTNKPITYADIEKKALGIAHVSHNSGENDWYTPAKYIESARKVMGTIDLDPATSELAQKTVQAENYFTVDDDGLAQTWSGNVWMNPPYSKELIGMFIHKACTDPISSAIVLVNNATDTKWFQELARSATAICFPCGRIKFIDKDGSPSGAPLQGQAIVYIGEDPASFLNEFSEYGFMMGIYNA